MVKLTDKNRLSIINPELCKEWDYEKNGKLRPEDVSCGSNKKVWWKCKKGHSLELKIRNRNKGGCPYCSGRRVDKSNCLYTLNPKLSKEWDCKKNKGVSAYGVTSKSGKKVWWKCKNGHSWEAEIKSRFVMGVGCPYCCGNKAHENNCLATLNPELCREWDGKKNKDITPDKITVSSNQKVWWKCKKGHSWLASPNNRSNHVSGCPYCKRVALKDGTSFASLSEAYYYLKHIKPKYKRIQFNKGYGKGMGKRRYDFYLPQINTYIEVTGFAKTNEKWGEYYKNIDKKKKYVEDVLKANFKFVQLKLTNKQILYVRKNSI